MKRYLNLPDVPLLKEIICRIHFIYIEALYRNLPDTKHWKNINNSSGGCTSPSMICFILSFGGKGLRGVSHIKLRSKKATSFTYMTMTGNNKRLFYIEKRSCIYTLIAEEKDISNVVKIAFSVVISDVNKIVPTPFEGCIAVLILLPK